MEMITLCKVTVESDAANEIPEMILWTNMPPPVLACCIMLIHRLDGRVSEESICEYVEKLREEQYWEYYCFTKETLQVNFTILPTKNALWN